jgi:hypothetical protein
MSEWAQTYDLNGKPVITVDKPGKRIEAVLDELQAKCINEIEGDDEGSGDTPVKVLVEPLTAQTMKIKAVADLSGFSKIDHNHDGVYAPYSEDSVTVMTGISSASLTTNGATLTLRIAFTAATINLKTMAVVEGTIPDLVASITGGPC